MAKDGLANLRPEQWTPQDEPSDAEAYRGTLLHVGRMAINEPTSSELGLALDDLRASLSSQLPFSVSAYQRIIEELNRGRSKNQWVPVEEYATLQTDFSERLNSRSMLSYIAGTIAKNPDVSFTLVTTPHVVASAKEILDAVGLDPKLKTWTELIEFYDSYHPTQLSGQLHGPNRLNCFSLIPDRPTQNLYGKVRRQKLLLSRLQQEYPFLMVPSFLEAVTYHQVLRSKKLPARADSFGESYLMHFDLPVKQFRGSNCVPMSFMLSSEQSFALMHNAEIPFNAKLEISF